MFYSDIFVLEAGVHCVSASCQCCTASPFTALPA